MNASRQTVLITGASGGIGYELAKLFARDHYDLVLVARSGPKLAQVGQELQSQHGITVKTIPTDLTLPNAPQALYEDVRRAGIHVDVLVNNAGYGIMGEFANIPLMDD